MKTILMTCILAMLSILSASAQWLDLPLDEFDIDHENKARIADFRLLREARAMQTQNQEMYDVLSYDIDITFYPDERRLSGVVTMMAEISKDFMSQLDIDLSENMEVTSITLFGDSVSYIHEDDLIIIDPDSTFHAGEMIEARIEYEGNPGGFGAMSTYNGKPLIWSLSQPYGARLWWPCKDQPSDKADSVDIRITVPAGMIVASNGTLREVLDNGVTETYWWHEGYPIVTYLVSVAIYEYYTYSDYFVYAPGDSMEIQFYVFPGHANSVQTNYAKVKTMLAIYSDLFGPYPFLDEKYGHAEFTWGGGMEHQTLTSLGAWSESLIAHELAHQWWGDMITCNDFHHIWLNEGFATYSEALYLEQRSGSGAYFSDMNSKKYYGSGTIYVPDATDESRIFHGGLSYDKGSWVLHMLRHVVGDEVFFDILHAWYDSRYRHGTAVTEDFQGICESVSGMELDWFFEEWIYGQYFPQYVYNWSVEDGEDSTRVYVSVEQIQTGAGVFTMPVDLTCSAPGREETVVVFNDRQTQDFEFSLDFRPTAVALDQDGWILKSVSQMSMSLISPNGGEHWSAGATKSIRWNAYHISETVGIDYSTDTGSSWEEIVPAVTNNRSYLWTVPSSLSSNCLIRIHDVDHPRCYDISDNTFTICESPRVDFSADPVDGEEYTCLVRFTDLSTGPASGWLWNFGDGGTSKARHPSHAFDCGASYTVSLTVSSACEDVTETKVQYITCDCPCLMELTSPGGGQLWCAGETGFLEWTSAGGSGQVTIEYSTDGGAHWMSVGEGIADDGAYEWTLPDIGSDECLVRVCDVSDSGCCAASPAFQICSCGTVHILTETLSDGAAGCPYEETLAIDGGCLPLAWSIPTGQLPKGVNLDAASGVLSGAPLETGTFQFEAEVSDSRGATDRGVFSLVIGEYVNVKGDATGDCRINVLDVLAAVNIILGLTEPDADGLWRADCNGPAGVCDGDGVIDILDALKMVNMTLGVDGCP